MIAQRKTIENDESYLRQVSQAVMQGEDYKIDVEMLREFCRGTEFFCVGGSTNWNSQADCIFEKYYS